MNRTVRFYEDTGGGICAIIYRGGKPCNIVSGLHHSTMRGADLIKAAQTGFEYADQYDPLDFNGRSLDDVVDEIDYMHEEIAMISGDSVTLYEDCMSCSSASIFGLR